jgi:hypothetical protein
VTAATPPQAAPAVAAPAADPPRSAGSSLLAALVANGYTDLSVEEIIDIKNAGVTAEYLTSLVRAWGKLPARELMEARRHGLSPDYAGRMRAAGVRDLTLAGVMQLRNHGVDPEHIQQIHALGFGPYTVRDAIEIRTHGVQPDLFRALRDSGFRHPDLRDVIEARRYGVRPEHLREAARIGNSLTLRQIIRLKNAGVI